MASSTSYTVYYNTYSATGTNLTTAGLAVATITASATTGIPSYQWWMSANSTLMFGGATSINDALSTGLGVVSAAGGSIVLNAYSTSSGNVLASFVAFIALMIASLFAF